MEILWLRSDGEISIEFGANHLSYIKSVSLPHSLLESINHSTGSGPRWGNLRYYRCSGTETNGGKRCGIENVVILSPEWKKSGNRRASSWLSTTSPLWILAEWFLYRIIHIYLLREVATSHSLSLVLILTPRASHNSGLVPPRIEMEFGGAQSFFHRASESVGQRWPRH